MENTLLNALKGAQGDVVAENHSTSVTFEFGGSIIMKRGTFEQRLYFYARVSETRHKGVISLDGWDSNEISDTKLDGLPIDDVYKTKQYVEGLGMTTLANRMEFSGTEQKIAICQCMLRDEQLKLLYGKDFKVWDILSDDEKKVYDLKFVVENYDTASSHTKLEVAKHFGLIEIIDNKVPTLKEFKKKLSEVSK